MKYLDEFRDANLLLRHLADLRRIVTRPWVIMDVCGGQTHSLLRHGIESELEGDIELIHGPGCPVCVTPSEVIDDAIRLSKHPDVILATFGDMLRIPGGSRETLMTARAQGGNVRIVYSPSDALEIARRHPDKDVIFFAVGFETTAPATALALLLAEYHEIPNFLLLPHHVRVEPAMRAIVNDPSNRVQGFLAAGHVCTVVGFDNYNSFVEEFQIPVVVTGFEPLDLVAGLRRCVELLQADTPRADNSYARCVRREGNLAAQRLIDDVYVAGDSVWRGFGIIPRGGLLLRPEWHHRDARLKYLAPNSSQPATDDECRSAEVLSGRLKPLHCPLFGTTCTPETPRGAPMVSSEGACAAYFLYPPLDRVANG